MIEFLLAVDRMIATLKAKLERSEQVLGVIGGLMVSHYQKAFADQGFGGKEWPPRYPGMDHPFLNIAGAIQDFSAGRPNPKPVRFQDRPALIDEGYRGGLVGSLTSKVVSPTEVQAGTAKPYADLHNRGGVSTQPITETTKAGIRKWLYAGNDKDGKPKLSKKQQKVSVKDPAYTTGSKFINYTRADFAPKLEPLLLADEWSQNVLKRQFVGMTDLLMSDIKDAILHFYKSDGSSVAEVA